MARMHTRLRTYLSGYVRTGRLRGENCTVRDVSVRGAKLLVTTEISLPDEFDLSILKWRQVHRVRLIWRKGREIGVEFCEPLKALSETDPKAELLGIIT